MHTDFLDTQLVAYLSLRDALGFQTRAEKLLLPEFVTLVKAQESPGPIRARMALEWACQESAHRGPSGASRRLGMARRFLRYLQASMPDTEVPDPGLLPTPRGQNRISSRPRSSRPSSRWLKRVGRVDHCAPTPYPP